MAELGSLASIVVLARLIDPSGFGRAAVAAFVLALVAVLVGSALAIPLVQRREIEQRHLRTAALLGIAGGAGLAALNFGIAEVALEPLYGDPTSDLVQLAGVGFVLAGIGVVPNALLQRRLDFKVLGLAEVAAVLVGISVSVGLAAGADVEATALVLGPLAGLAASTLVVSAAAGLAWPGWDRSVAGELLRFGGAATGSSMAVAIGRNVDYAALATQVGSSQVGLYWRAYQLGVDYQSKISQVLVRLAFPLYARSADLDAVRRIRTRIMRAHAVVLLPLLALFAATAPVLVPFVFGDEWEGAVVPAQILSIAGMVAAVQTGLGPLMNAVGRPGRSGILVAAFIPVIVVLVIALAPLGIVAVAIGMTVNAFAVLVASYRFLLQPYAGVHLRELVGDAGPAAVGSAAVVALALPLTKLLEDRLHAVPVVLIAALVAVPTYLVLLRRFFPAAWEDAMTLWRQRPSLRRRGGTPPPQVRPDPARSVG